ncbi:hypothetical protein ACWCYY_18475 [Kitasatospora sp. NPDC001664]
MTSDTIPPRPHDWPVAVEVAAATCYRLRRRVPDTGKGVQAARATAAYDGALLVLRAVLGAMWEDGTPPDAVAVVDAYAEWEAVGGLPPVADADPEAVAGRIAQHLQEIAEHTEQDYWAYVAARKKAAREARA